ncbi:TPA: hypothetical protein ACH3X2_004200 [Trebouxia sp. C0005]
MSTVTELDLAIQQVDSLLSKLQVDSKVRPSVQEPKPVPSKDAEKAGKKLAGTARTQPKDTGSAAGPAAGSQPTVHDLFAKAQLQVARVTSVEEIDSVKLYKCIVDIGKGVTKQVMAGLKQHMAKEQLLQSLIVVITNLKAAKLAGEVSKSMILAAQAPDPSVPQGEIVQVLQVPEGSEPGDGIFMEGQALGTAFPKTLKSDVWKKIVADLQVHNHTACCAKQKLVTAKGPVHLPSTIPDGAGIH